MIVRLQSMMWLLLLWLNQITSVLSNDHIAYLSGFCNDLAKIDKIKKQNTTEKMINYLNKKNSIVWCYIMMEKISAH